MREEGEEEVRKIQTTESPWRKGGGGFQSALFITNPLSAERIKPRLRNQHIQ